MVGRAVKLGPDGRLASLRRHGLLLQEECCERLGLTRGIVQRSNVWPSLNRVAKFGVDVDSNNFDPKPSCRRKSDLTH